MLHLYLLKEKNITPDDIIEMFKDSYDRLPSDISGQSYSVYDEKQTDWKITYNDWENGKLEGTYESCIDEYDGNALVYISPSEIKNWKVDFGVEPVVIFPNCWTVEKLIKSKQS